MENHHEENQLREVPDLDTLHELLTRLNSFEAFEPVSRTEKITVEDIAEALHLDPDDVALQLETILDEHREARIAGALREMEEPLFRVERPGHFQAGPLDNPLHKLRSVQILMSRNQDRKSVPRRSIQETKPDHLGHLFGRFMIILMFVLFAILGAKIVIAMIMQK